MGLDNQLYGKRPDAKSGSFVTFASWRKNWHVHSLLEEAFNGVDAGGFMNISLDAEQLEKAISQMRKDPLHHADIPAFERALDWLRDGAVVSVTYGANW